MTHATSACATAEEVLRQARELLSQRWLRIGPVCGLCGLEIVANDFVTARNDDLVHEACGAVVDALGE